MIGKPRKVSKGYSSGFIPDYRYAVETVAESEGFGSTGRVNVEMTASANSCAPNSKCPSLNVDGYDHFGVPVQVLSLSKMSKAERKGLERRLKHELQQVRGLQRRIASVGSNVTALSSSDYVDSCNDKQKQPVSNNIKRSKEACVQHGKKKGPPGRTGPQTKVASGKHSKSSRQVLAPSTSIAALMKQCETLLNRLMSHQYAWVFNTPVDVVKLNLPDYFTIIKHPMDLGTVQSKLLADEYNNLLGFAADVRLTFSNAIKYNPPGNDVNIMANTLLKFFEIRWKPIEKKLSLATDLSVTSKSNVIDQETSIVIPQSKKRKIISPEMHRQEAIMRVMTNAEKQKLSTELASLLEELPDSIIEFLKQNSFGGSQVNDDEIEIDIDALSDDTLFQLRKLLDDFLLDRTKNQGKDEPCELELHNESRFSNSSLPPCKDNDLADEDVDIGGNDPAVSSFPSLEIETEAIHGNSKHCISNCQNNESGSSFNDSYSGSSDNSAADDAKVSAPTETTKDPLVTVTQKEQKQSCLDDLGTENNMLNELSNIECNSQSRLISTSAEATGQHEGENAPSGRQVSPGKLYRAALLRSRFADTILKAQEKTLEEGEKQDPEKMRLEREELERHKREEKARLQAEAKAAEEARIKAEAEAAAEAKRMRDREREAARQALLKMEKTVDINENSRFIKDLEMLTAPDHQTERFMEEMTPEDPQNGFGSFKFGPSSNPLEQLGLYMKVDEEEEEDGQPHGISNVIDNLEEEEVQPHGVSNAVDDVEEGEVD